MAFQPVPTYADPVLVNEKDPKKSQFNPVWLSWFLTLTNGGIASSVSHQSLLNLQGGASGQYYHLTAAEHAAVNYRSSILPSGITVGASPFLYQNANSYDLDVITLGGTVSLIEFTRDNVTFYPVGFVSGILRLSPSDRIRVTYSVAPTLTGVPR